MKIDFEILTASNFMSYSNLCYDFKKGTTQILGANGQGKSTIYEALLWCCYGDTARGIAEKKRVDVIKRGEKLCTVIVSGYTVGTNNKRYAFRIARQDGSKKIIEVTIDGKVYCTKNLNIDQETVNKLLSMDKNQFLSVTLLGHNSFDFNSVGDADMKKVLNKYIDTDKFVYAQTYSFSMYKEISGQINQLNGYRSGIEESINRLKEDAFVLNKRNIEKNKREISELRRKESKLQKRKKDLSLVEKPDYDELKNLEEQYTDVTGKMGMHLSKEQEILKLDKKCFVCNSPISSKDRKTMLLVNRAMYIKYNKMALDLLNKINKIKALADLENERNSINIDISVVQNDIRRLSSENTKSAKKSDESVKELEQKIKNTDKLVKDKEKQLEIYNFWSKGFGNSGVIGYMVDGIINRLNEKLSDISVELTSGYVIVQYSPYSKSQKGNVREVIDKVCFINGEETSYASMSNSERQRTKLLTLFAFRELSEEETNISINVMFFDEVFEGLDAENSALAIKYINSFNNKSITIMSHAQNVKYKANRTFSVINKELIKQ